METIHPLSIGIVRLVILRICIINFDRAAAAAAEILFDFFLEELFVVVDIIVHSWRLPFFVIRDRRRNQQRKIAGASLLVYYSRPVVR